ncbi:hypothetical protein C7B61_11910, partial [filamentous cyanobacterium CCP1]
MYDLSLRSFFLTGTTAATLLCLASIGWAQPLPSSPAPSESSDSAGSFPVPDPSEAPPPLPITPPAPPPDPQFQVPDTELPPLDPLVAPSFWLDEVRVLGSTVLQDEIEALVREY